MAFDAGIANIKNRYIGSIMQAHTNLTEIKKALDLFWRVGVDPSKVILGTAFYGRSYTMNETDCIQPGCPFSSAGAAAPCTDSAGTLSYKGMEVAWIVLLSRLATPC
jgi:chitinase